MALHPQLVLNAQNMGHEPLAIGGRLPAVGGFPPVQWTVVVGRSGVKAKILLIKARPAPHAHRTVRHSCPVRPNCRCIIGPQPVRDRGGGGVLLDHHISAFLQPSHRVAAPVRAELALWGGGGIAVRERQMQVRKMAGNRRKTAIPNSPLPPSVLAVAELWLDQT